MRDPSLDYDGYGCRTAHTSAHPSSISLPLPFQADQPHSQQALLSLSLVRNCPSDSLSPLTHSTLSSQRDDDDGPGARMTEEARQRQKDVLRQLFRKTKMCPWLHTGKCTRQDRCNFAHTLDELRPRPSNTDDFGFDPRYWKKPKKKKDKVRPHYLITGSSHGHSLCGPSPSLCVSLDHPPPYDSIGFPTTLTHPDANPSYDNVPPHIPPITYTSPPYSTHSPTPTMHPTDNAAAHHNPHTATTDRAAIIPSVDPHPHTHPLPLLQMATWPWSSPLSEQPPMSPTDLQTPTLPPSYGVVDEAHEQEHNDREEPEEHVGELQRLIKNWGCIVG
ncbi:unnamed protein product [Vitrella brassicaformis CCMP3155]|uniref:C3H1-type domain-containing protein n=1 Tax=Vitrella brassicaformis (strain CCMP3155) TaxID=1169540 RepID=A0A0G4FGU2_VITBC|nr:unnamed protein product [Vitrella brassicaformis CCMP3155]|eukprot:CEM12668.1 unnamed protein product [Vitrella brassicaformis CCMP3155]